MVPPVLRYNNGFSLIEAMIAVLLLTVMMMWSIQGLMTVTQSVSNNKIRQEAVKLGQELLIEGRNEGYVPLASWDNANFPAYATWNAAAVAAPAIPSTATISRQIASYNINFYVTRTVVVEVANSKSVTYTILWNKNGQHSYVARTIVSDK